MKRAVDEHAEVVELLPWFVNGTLSEVEHTRVERHVRACLTCYSALQQERRMQTRVRDASAERLSAAQGFDRLMARIDGESGQGGSARRERRGRAWRYAGAAAAAGLAAAGLLLWLWLGLAGGPTGTAPYETASGPSAGTGAELDIIFAAGLPETEMRALLRDIDATIVAGPTEIGRYTVRLDSSATDDTLADVIARLMRDPRVRFAGRSYIGGEP